MDRPPTPRPPAAPRPADRGTLPTGSGSSHLTESFDTHVSFCSPRFATTQLDLEKPGAPRCGDCIVNESEGASRRERRRVRPTAGVHRRPAT